MRQTSDQFRDKLRANDEERVPPAAPALLDRSKLLDEIVAEGWDVSLQYMHSTGLWSCALCLPDWWTDNLYDDVELPVASCASRLAALEGALRKARRKVGPR